MLAFGCSLVIVGDLAIRLAPAGTEVAAWWPGAGIAVAVALRLGRRHLLGVLSATWLASVFANLSGGREPVVSLLFSTLNATEVAVVFLLMHAWNPQLRLGSVRALILTGLAAAGGALTAGVLAGLTVWTQLGGDFWVTTQAVSASHASAVLLFLPFGLAHGRYAASASRPEVVLTAAGLAGATYVIFAENQSLPLVFLLFPLLVVTAFRQSLRATAIQLIVVSTMATATSAAGWGPLVLAVQGAGLQPETAGGILQTFMASAAVMVYTLRVTVESRHSALAESRRTHSRLQAVIDSAPSTSIIQTDLDGVIRVFNQGAVNLLGYSAEQMVGRCTPAVFHDPAEVAARAQELGISPGFEVFVHEVREGHAQSERRDWAYITSDGTRRLVSLVVSRVEDADGQTIGFLGIAEDVGARRQVEQLLVHALEHERRLAAELRVADELKTEFVSSVSHELRTPMTSVLGYTALLEEQYGDVLDAHGTELVSRIESNGRRLLGLVDDLLTLSRIESGALELDLTRFDMTAVVRSAIAVLEPIAHDSRVTLAAELPDTPVPIDGDRREIERALINLLTNAIKFTSEGGTVTVELLPSGPSGMTVTVRDSGCGIPSEDLDKVFTRFHRAVNVRETATPGTGLGLAIVKAIVERHHGRIHVTSEVGHGSTFSITLPSVHSVAELHP